MARDPKNPVDNVGQSNMPAFPRSANADTPAVLVGAIVDPITGAITGYLPLKVVNNGDGTCTLVTTT